MRRAAFWLDQQPTNRADQRLLASGKLLVVLDGFLARNVSTPSSHCDPPSDPESSGARAPKRAAPIPSSSWPGIGAEVAADLRQILAVFTRYEKRDVGPAALKIDGRPNYNLGALVYVPASGALAGARLLIAGFGWSLAQIASASLLHAGGVPGRRDLALQDVSILLAALGGALLA